jgi:hypothetical protein
MLSVSGGASELFGVLAHQVDHETDRHANWLGESNFPPIGQRNRMLYQHVWSQAFQCGLRLGEETGK